MRMDEAPPDRDPPPTCRSGCDDPADAHDPDGRCEDCVDRGLSRCRGYECGALASGADYCRRCQQDIDDCAREDAADAARDDVNF